MFFMVVERKGFAAAEGKQAKPFNCILVYISNRIIICPVSILKNMDKG